MLYLKYRPKTIADLDNSAVREVLTNLLSSGPLPHALLFTGQKGTGKTSTARIIAKSVNCLNLQNKFEPCDTCTNCLAISTGASPDVIELDAASNRGIEEVRNLIKEAAFAPMMGTYRVFIIDEAHMITNDAFNALLKTLEEPPKNVIFILATTNEEKIPKTIASRCIRVIFGKAKKSDIHNKLKKIVTAENIVVDELVLKLITDHADSSFRDAIKVFDELITQKKTSLKEATEYLGSRSKQGLLEILQSGTETEALAWLNTYIQQGGSIKFLIETILEALREQLLIKHGINEEGTIALKFSNTQLVVLLKLLQEAYTNLKFAPIESIPLEIALVEYYNKITK